MGKIKEFYTALKNISIMYEEYGSITLLKGELAILQEEYRQIQEQLPILLDTVQKLGAIITQAQLPQSPFGNVNDLINKVVNDPMQAKLESKDKIEFNNALLNTLRNKRSAIQGSAAVGSAEVIAKNKVLLDIDAQIAKLEKLNSQLSEISQAVPLGV